jgi:hypothetical protein
MRNFRHDSKIGRLAAREKEVTVHIRFVALATSKRSSEFQLSQLRQLCAPILVNQRLLLRTQKRTFTLPGFDVED